MKRFSKAICLALLVVAMTFTLAGCKSPKQDVGDIVITAPEAETPAVVEEPAPVEEAKEEAPVVEEPAPVEEVKEEAPVVEEPKAEVAVVYKPVAKKYTFAGYELTVIADKGRAVITYPSIIAKADIDAAAQAAVAAYGKAYDLSGVYYDVDEKNHVLTVYYPESWGMEELALAEQIIMKELPGYAAAAYAALQPAEEEVVAEEVVEPAFYTRDIELYGYKASIIATGNKVGIEYPAFVTTAEVRAAAEAVYAAYGQYLQGSTLDIYDGDGFAILTLAYDLTEADFNYAADLVEAQLPAYVQSLFAQAPAEEEPVEVEEVAVVAEAPAAEETPAVEEPAPAEEVKEEAPVVEEQPAKTEEPAKQPEAPKQEETKTETPVAQPAATPAAEPAPAKKSNVGLIVLIIVLVLVAAAAVVVVLKKKKN